MGERYLRQDHPKGAGYMSGLADRKLEPPRGSNVPALRGAELSQLYELLGNEWKVIGEHHLEKEFRLKNFQLALDLTNQIGALAEEVDHHPEICLTWGSVKLTLWTHSIGGLSEADFVFAARVDVLAG
jgi:4a-hydroxytetrahydrobiopterin dehydratase